MLIFVMSIRSSVLRLSTFVSEKKQNYRSISCEQIGINEWSKDMNSFTIFNLSFAVNIVQMYGLLYSDNFCAHFIRESLDMKNG